MGFDQRLYSSHANEPLHHEQRLLEDWFRNTFAMQAAQGK
jgi:hypothetical protein